MYSYRSPSERSGKGCCGQWFAGPPLRALIAVVALGGVACALGGAALGATGLAGPPSSHFTAALLMIGKCTKKKQINDRVIHEILYIWSKHTSTSSKTFIFRIIK